MKKNAAKIACAVGVVLSLVAYHQSQKPKSERLRTSPQGLELIGNAEGCARAPYKCPADVLTVGIGTTSAVEKIQPHKIYSEAEIAVLFEKGVALAEQCVNRYANGEKLPQGAFDALTSITFNVGCAKLQNSTLFKFARAGKLRPMCDQLTRWKYANGQVLTGLEIRRQKERELCLTF